MAQHRPASNEATRGTRSRINRAACGTSLSGLVLAAIALFVLTPMAPAGAQGVSDSHNVGPDWIWDVQTPAKTNHTNNIRALVHDLAEHDGRIYAGGKFLETVSPTGERVSQPYLAAYDIASGALDRSFTPDLDGAVYTIKATPDGQIIVGGEFTGGIAVLDKATGERLSTFPATVSLSWGHAVWDIEFFDGSAYIGGYFERANGQARDNIAKFAYPSGALDTGWVTGTQGIDDGTRLSNNPMVWGLDIDEGRRRLLIAGKFDSVNNDADIDNFAVVSTSTGALISSVPQSDPIGALNHDDCAPGDEGCWHIDNWFYDVQYDAELDRVYLGGQAHTTIRLRASDLKVLDNTFTNTGLDDAGGGGDTQVIAIGKDTIWSGCHCFGSVALLPVFDHELFGTEYREIVTDFTLADNQSVRGLFGQDRSSGSLTPQVFDLTGQSGSWAMLEDSYGRLWSGGLWQSGGGRSLSGLARFSPVGGVKPVAPASCTAALVDGEIRVSWTRAQNDLATGFVIRRSRDGGAHYWRSMIGAPGTVYTDASVALGSSYGYTVETLSGNDTSGPRACIPTPIEVTANSTAPVAPGSCSVRLVGGNVEVSWTRAANDNATAFVVRRSRNSGPYYWASRSGTVTTWTDNNTDPGNNYGYTVETRAGSTASTATTCSPSPITVTAGVGEPVSPSSCTLRVVAGRPVLSWTDSPSDSGDEVVVRRSRNGGQFFWATKLRDPISTWTDNNTDPRFTYAYSVESRLDGRSSASTTPCR